MLEIARNSFNLKDFETRLQHHLEEIFGLSISITVSCVLNDDRLMILVQTEKSVSQSKVFSEIKKILRQESLPQSLQIQMGLMVNDNVTEFSHFLDADFKRQTFLFLSPIVTFFKKQFPYKNYSLTMITGIGTGIILLLGGIYLGSRPCSIGSCQIIPQAQQLSQEAITLFETSDRNLTAAQERLTQAIKQLQKIPWWSSYHSQAISLLSLYHNRLDNLEQIILAREKASQAVTIAQKTPLSVSQWREIKQLWEEAIIAFNQLSPESPFFSFAQVKTKEYQRNLISVTQRLQAEKQSQVSLESAQKAAKIAKVRQNSAQSVGDLQLVYATWQTVIKRLREIAPGTTSNQQGQQLLNSYMPELTKSGTRLQQEKLAHKYYNQAVEQAQLAEKYQQSKQWSLAVSYWRKAITFIKQIQSNTFTASQAQPLMSNYRVALNQAEVNLKNAVKFYQVRQQLEEVCIKIQNICQYKITNNSIKVNLTPAYMQQVWQTALHAQAQANIRTQIELLNHISQLEQTWQMISDKAKKNVEIYNPKGELLVSYEPKK